MQVVLEKPVTWLESERDGNRNRLMYESLLAAFNQLGIAPQEVETHYGNDFIPRVAPEGGVLISYHSVGDSKNVWRIKETPIPYFYNIDKLGYSGWSELSVLPQKHLERIERIDRDSAEEFRKKISNWLRADNLSKYAQSDAPLPIKSGFVFFPLQVRSDSVSIHNRFDPLKVLKKAAYLAWLCKKPLVVKRHPFDTSKRVKLCVSAVEKINPYVISTSASVASILPACDAVLVGNSGVGLEAIVHGKPSYSFARSEYDCSSFKIFELGDLRSMFKRSDYSPHPLSSKFIDYFLRELCFDARDINDTKTKIKKILDEKQ